MFLPLVLAAQLSLSPEIPIAAGVIRTAPGPQAQPALASDGSNFFGAWEDHRQDVVGARIDGSGAVLDATNGVSLQPTWVNDNDPSIVWNGSTYAVVFWSGDPSKPYGAKAIEVTAGGEVAAERTAVGPRAMRDIDIAWNGSLYLMTWIEEGGSVRALLMDRAFQGVGGEIVLGEGGAEVAVASNGTGFLAAWTTTPGSTYAAAVAPDGSATAATAVAAPSVSLDVASNGAAYALFAAGEIVALSSDGRATQRVPMPAGEGYALAWSGFRYVAVWSAGERIHAAELTSSLVFVRTPERLVAQDSVQRWPAVAFNGSRTMVVWSDGDSVSSDIRSAFLGERETTRLVSSGLTHQFPVDALWAGERLMTLWREGDGASASLRLGSIGSEGFALEPAFDARLAWNGAMFVVVSIRGEGLNIEWLSPAGEPLRDRAVIPGHAAGPLHIATDGRDFLAAWRSGADTHIVAIGADGRLGPVRVLPHAQPGSVAPATGVAWNGREYVVLLHERIGTRFGTSSVASVAVSAAGAVGTTTMIMPPTSTFSQVGLSSVTSTGTDVLYVWSNGSETRAKLGIAGEEVVLFSGSASVERAAWDGHDFLFLVRDGGYSLMRGEARVPLSGPAFLAAAPSRRAAIVYNRYDRLVPNLDTLRISRAYAQLVLGKRTRAARH